MLEGSGGLGASVPVGLMVSFLLLPRGRGSKTTRLTIRWHWGATALVGAYHIHMVHIPAMKTCPMGEASLLHCSVERNLKVLMRE